jgi:tetratricopeptide (TPR) repeat protein
LVLEDAGRSDVSPAPTDLPRPRSDEAARKNAARAEAQAVRARRPDLETAADEGDGEAIGKRGAKLLDIPLAQGAGRREDADALCQHVQAMTEGNAFFDAGALDGARAAYERALAASRTPEQKVAALQKLGRTLERQGRYAEARSLYSRCTRLQRDHPELDQSTTARTHLFLGWLDYRQGNYDPARERFGAALELARGKRDDWLLGNVSNGLGLLEKRAEVFEKALARFRTALDYRCRADYPYGVAAAYANIGNTYLSWGNQLRDARLITEARSRYRRAVEWLARCLEFGTGARLGEDTSEAQVALAEAFLGLDERDRALEMARAGRDAAQKAGNQLDLASALSVMASVLWLKGNREEASACAEDAAARFDQLGHPARALKIRQNLEKKALSSHPKLGRMPRTTDPQPGAIFSAEGARHVVWTQPRPPLYQLLDASAPVAALRRLGAAWPSGRRIAGNRGFTKQGGYHETTKL